MIIIIIFMILVLFFDSALFITSETRVVYLGIFFNVFYIYIYIIVLLQILGEAEEEGVLF